MRREFGGRSSSDSKASNKRSQEATTDTALSPYHSQEDLSAMGGGADDDLVHMYHDWVDGLSTGNTASRARSLSHIQDAIIRLNAPFLLFAADHQVTILDQSLKLFLDGKVERKVRRQALHFVVQFVLVCGDDHPELYDRAARSLTLDVLLHPLNQPTNQGRGGKKQEEEGLLAEAWAALSLLYAANDRVVVDDQPLSTLLLTHESSPLSSSSKPKGRLLSTRHVSAAALTAASCIDISQRRTLKALILLGLEADTLLAETEQHASSSGTTPTSSVSPTSSTVMSPTTAASALASAGGDNIPEISPLCYLWTAIGVLEDRFHGTFADVGGTVLGPLSEHPTPDKPLAAMQRAVLMYLGVAATATAGTTTDESSSDGNHISSGAPSSVPSKRIQFRERHVEVNGFANIYFYDICRLFFGEMLLVHVAKNATIRRVLHVTGDVAARHTQEEIARSRELLQERLIEKEETLKERAKQRKSKATHNQVGDDE